MVSLRQQKMLIDEGEKCDKNYLYSDKVIAKYKKDSKRWQ